MPDATELCAAADLQSMLGLSTTPALLTLIKNSVEAWAKTYCGRDFLVPSTPYTEYHDGDGSAILRVRQRPIISITSIYVDPGRLFSSASLIPATDIIDDSEAKNNGYVELFTYRFLEGRKSVKITYSGGYATIPADLSGAVRKIIAQQYKVADKKLYAEITQEVGDKRITLNPDAYPKDAMTVLDRYRRIEI